MSSSSDGGDWGVGTSTSWEVLLGSRKGSSAGLMSSDIPIPISRFRHSSGRARTGSKSGSDVGSCSMPAVISSPLSEEAHESGSGILSSSEKSLSYCKAVGGGDKGLHLLPGDTSLIVEARASTVSVHPCHLQRELQNPDSSGRCNGMKTKDCKRGRVYVHDMLFICPCSPNPGSTIFSLDARFSPGALEPVDSVDWAARVVSTSHVRW